MPSTNSSQYSYRYSSSPDRGDTKDCRSLYHRRKEQGVMIHALLVPYLYHMMPMNDDDETRDTRRRRRLLLRGHGCPCFMFGGFGVERRAGRTLVASRGGRTLLSRPFSSVRDPISCIIRTFGAATSIAKAKPKTTTNRVDVSQHRYACDSTVCTQIQ